GSALAPWGRPTACGDAGRTTQVSSGRQRAALAAVVTVGLPVVVFALHAAPLRNWLIDDAGISFAYARHVAAGYGLVAQPDAPPVEGFSNPLWTLLLAGFFRLGLFDVTWTPKAVSLAFVAFTFTIMAADLCRERLLLWPACLGTTLLATS